MKALLTEKEAAELMGITPRWLRERAGEFATVSGEKAANGKSPKLYDLASLPADAALAWAQQQQQNVVAITSAPGQLALDLAIPAGPNLSPEDRQQAERRFGVIEPLVQPERFRGLWAQCRNRKGALIAMLAREQKTKPRTIYHWLKAWKDGGLQALVTRERRDKGKPKALNAAALDFLLAAALPRQGAYGELSVAEIYRAYGEERAWRAAHNGKPLGDFELRKYSRYLDGDGRLAPTAQLPHASYETFRTWFDRIPEVVRTMARGGLEQFANTQEIISFRALTEVKPLDYVVMDHRRLDLFCLVHGRDGWTLMRPWLTAAIDMRTRKWLAWGIFETPSSDSIATVLKRVFLDHGLPAGLYWDNGKDFTCEWFEGARSQTRQAGRVAELSPAWRGVLDSLGVRVHHAIVRRARSKIIEPCFRATALYDKSTPWWCGHKPTARPERFGALMVQHERWLKGAAEPAFPTIEQIAALYNEELEAINERPHQGEGMQKVTPTGRDWMCPNECWEKLIGRVERRTVAADVMQFCFAKRRTVTVHSGEVRTTFGGRQFHYRLIENQIRLMAFNGREVEFAYDPNDLQTVALYCESRFLGLAQNLELRRMGEESFVQDERDRRIARREVKKFIAAVHKAVPMADMVERAARRQEVQPARIPPARVEAPAAIAAPFVEAAEAAKQDTEFSFSECTSGIDVVRPKEDDAVDDEFEFFGGTK
jgi:hypothetical protein